MQPRNKPRRGTEGPAGHSSCRSGTPRVCARAAPPLPGALVYSGAGCPGVSRPSSRLETRPPSTAAPERRGKLRPLDKAPLLSRPPPPLLLLGGAREGAAAAGSVSMAVVFPAGMEGPGWLPPLPGFAGWPGRDSPAGARAPGLVGANRCLQEGREETRGIPALRSGNFPQAPAARGMLRPSGAPGWHLPRGQRPAVGLAPAGRPSLALSWQPQRRAATLGPGAAPVPGSLRGLQGPSSPGDLGRSPPGRPRGGKEARALPAGLWRCPGGPGEVLLLAASARQPCCRGVAGVGGAFRWKQAPAPS